MSIIKLNLTLLQRQDNTRVTQPNPIANCLLGNRFHVSKPRTFHDVSISNYLLTSKHSCGKTNTLGGCETFLPYFFIFAGKMKERNYYASE